MAPVIDFYAEYSFHMIKVSESYVWFEYQTQESGYEEWINIIAHGIDILLNCPWITIYSKYKQIYWMDDNNISQCNMQTSSYIFCHAKMPKVHLEM